MFDHPICFSRISYLTTPTEILADTNEKAFAPPNGETTSETPLTEMRKDRCVKKGKAFYFPIFFAFSE